MNIDPYLTLMAQKNASDIYFTTGAPPSIKIEGEMRRISNNPLEPGQVKWLGLAAGYGHLQYRPLSWQPIPCDRAVRVDIEKLG